MKKKIIKIVELPDFEQMMEDLPADSKIFVDKSMAIASYISNVMRNREMKQKDLADRLGKSEAEVSKLLNGTHNYTLRSLSKLEAALDIEIIHVPSTYKFIMNHKTKLEMTVYKNEPIDVATKFDNSINYVYKEKTA